MVEGLGTASLSSFFTFKKIHQLSIRIWVFQRRGYYWKFASDISSDNLNFINEDIKEKYYEMTA